MASKFIVKSGCSKGEFDGVILSTDLEPDDAIAISALAPKLRGVPLLCVVGEGRVDFGGTVDTADAVANVDTLELPTLLTLSPLSTSLDIDHTVQ